MMEPFELRCIYCGGNPFEPDHEAHCDGQQGGHDDDPDHDIPRRRETSAQSFYNEVNSGRVRTRRQQVWVALTVLGASTAIEVYRYLRAHFEFLGDCHSITPRFAELRDLGLVKEAGERECQYTGANSITWEAIKPEDWRAPNVERHRCETCGQLMYRRVVAQ